MLHPFLRRFAAISLVALLAACTTPMGLTGKTKQLDLSQKSLVLATLQLTRSDGRTMPWPLFAPVAGKDSSTGKTVQLFKVDEEGMDYGDDSRRYTALMRLSLAPGKYVLQNVTGQIRAFPFSGIWQVPLGASFEVPAESVIYLGRVTADMRARKDSEFRAGSLLPLIDQGVLGISTSTFDIAVSDQSALDLPLFNEHFPALRGHQVHNRILPPFDREVMDREFRGEPPVSAPAAAATPAVANR